jgi:hypothetical protein
VYWAGVREEGAGSVQGVGGWQSVVVLQQGWQDTQLITPPPRSSYSLVSFVIVDSAAGTVPSMSLSPKLLQCTAPSPTAGPPAAEACPRTDRQGGLCGEWRVSVWRE